MDSVGDPNLSTVVGRPLLYDTALLPTHTLEDCHLVLLQELAHETVVVPDRPGVTVSSIDTLLLATERVFGYARILGTVRTS